jgi:hypothetical protein
MILIEGRRTRIGAVGEPIEVCDIKNLQIKHKGSGDV